MTLLFKHGKVFTKGLWKEADLFVSDNKLFVFDGTEGSTPAADRTIDATGKIIIPGLTDVHVHFREPGFSYKETIRTGSLAAAHGGYTCVCPMPNLDPAPSTLDSLQVQLDIIRRDACIHVVPYGSITALQDGRSGLSDMEAMAPYVCAFSDDGKGVQDRSRMEEAMRKAASLGKIIVAHCEDESLLGGTAIHDGKYAASIGHKGITSASEWRQIERDCELSYKTGCAYHVCHVSAKESVQVLREAKKSGVNVTAETCPHYLTMCDMDLQDHGRFKMNPPIRDAEDREALREAICDGTLDMIVTDHAPHTAEENSRGILNSAFGVVGLETAFSVLYCRLVREDQLISLDKLIHLMAIAPRQRFGLPGGCIEDGAAADFAVWDPDRHFTVDPDTFLSKGRATPFEGWALQGACCMTVCGGTVVWDDGTL